MHEINVLIGRIGAGHIVSERWRKLLVDPSRELVSIPVLSHGMIQGALAHLGASNVPFQGGAAVCSLPSLIGGRYYPVSEAEKVEISWF
jgi:hypothetical protein